MFQAQQKKTEYRSVKVKATVEDVLTQSSKRMNYTKRVARLGNVTLNGEKPTTDQVALMLQDHQDPAIGAKLDCVGIVSWERHALIIENADF